MVNNMKILKEVNRIMLFGTCFSFFVGFPGSCPAYDGPHTLECYQCMWLEAGCIRAGDDFPAQNKLTVNQIAELDALNVE